MADSLDASLRRSLVLALDVLERASERRVDWSQTSLQSRPGTTDYTGPRSRPGTTDCTRVQPIDSSSQREQSFHMSLSALSHSEQSHVCRFHSSMAPPTPPLTTPTSPMAPLPSHQPSPPSLTDAPDFQVLVRPGLYSITASHHRSPRQHSRQVSLSHGESALLRFEL
uniref:Uncharacterized protein n=1 Tax=Knipowitschia caucasica TaxID=637954 RepID=A0AAV2KYV2_KNICA